MYTQLVVPLVKSIRDVVSVTVKTNIRMGEPVEKNDGVSDGAIGVCVGITGKLKGQIVFSMSKEIACEIATKMMGIEVTQLDEVPRSAVSELCNMIMGSTASMLFESGIEIDITPPAFMSGENLSYLSTNNVSTLCIPFAINENQIINVELFILKS